MLRVAVDHAKATVDGAESDKLTVVEVARVCKSGVKKKSREKQFRTLNGALDANEERTEAPTGAVLSTAAGRPTSAGASTSFGRRERATTSTAILSSEEQQKSFEISRIESRIQN